MSEMNHNKLKVIEIYGSHRQMGQQMGEARAVEVRHSIENAHSLVDTAYSTLQLDWSAAQIQARKYIPFAEERYP